MPEEAAVFFAEGGEFRGGEAGGFARALEAEDVFEAIADVVGGAGGFDQIVGEGFVFVGVVVERGQFFQVEFLEALVELIDPLGVFGFVAGGFHDGVGDFHVRKGIEHRDFFAEDVIVVNQGGPVTAKFVGNGGVVFVGEILNGLLQGQQQGRGWTRADA